MEDILSSNPEETFAVGELLGRELRPGDVVLLRGGLGAGKTLFTKGIAHALGYDVDEVTSPSFALVNLYRTNDRNIYHIDLWRIDGSSDAAFAVNLDEILDDPHAVTVIEWAERLNRLAAPGRLFTVEISGDGDDPRRIAITRGEQ